MLGVLHRVEEFLPLKLQGSQSGLHIDVALIKIGTDLVLLELHQIGLKGLEFLPGLLEFLRINLLLCWFIII